MRALLSNFFASAFFIALCLCVAPHAFDLFETFSTSYIPYFDFNYFCLLILGTIYISITSQCALQFSKKVSFIPYHIPLNLTVRSKNYPNNTSTQSIYTILIVLYVLLFRNHIILISLFNFRSLDQLLF